MALTERYARHYENPFYFRAIFDPLLQVSFEHGFFALKTGFNTKNPKKMKKIFIFFARTSPMKRLSSRTIFFFLQRKTGRKYDVMGIKI